MLILPEGMTLFCIFCLICFIPLSIHHHILFIQLFAVRLTKSSKSHVMLCYVMVFPKRHMKYSRRCSVFIGDDEAIVVQQIDGDVYCLTRWDSQKVGDAYSPESIYFGDCKSVHVDH